MLRRSSHFEALTLKAFKQPTRLYRPQNWSNPVLFASPHSGNHYPASFQAHSALHLRDLRRNEDVFIDQLFSPAMSFGSPLLAAQFPRCFVDVNRAPDELPSEWQTKPGLTTSRAEIGLGVVPTLIAEGMHIYKKPLTGPQALNRIDALYHPYHNILSRMIDTARDTFGHAILIDCHSMPGFTPQGSRRPDIILGDRYGVSCLPETTAFAKSLFEACGYSVSKNYPYAGGYVATHYGRPMDGIEVLQIEINRDLYVNPITYRPKSGYDRLARDLRDIIQNLTEGFAYSGALAAE